MNRENNATRTSNRNRSEKRSKPEINPNYMDDIEVEFSSGLKLEEDTNYIGTIKECFAFNGNKGLVLKLIIAVESEGGDWETVMPFPLKPFSPLKPLFADVKDEVGRTPKLKDLVDLDVEFSIKINEEFQNLKTIVWIEANENEEDDDFYNIGDDDDE